MVTECMKYKKATQSDSYGTGLCRCYTNMNNQQLDPLRLSQSYACEY